MPVAEIAATVTSVRASLDLLQSMIGLRDAEAMRSKTVELKGLMLECLDQALTARIAQTEQLDRIRTLEAEIVRMKEWDAEKQKYELKSVGRGAMAYMLKPEARGAEPAHWLCPNCFSEGKKRFFQPQPVTGHFGNAFECIGCKSKIVGFVAETPRWAE